jgi:sugar lactone lactonase YvrE
VVPKSSGTIFGQTVIADSAAILTASAGLQQPTGLAFDANGDLFLTNSDNYLTVIPATTSTVFGQSMTANVMVGLTISNSALLQPGEIAFDGHGNLYVANVAGNTVTVIPASSGTLFGQSVTADTVATLAAATGLHNPTGLALDAAGNLYVTNAGTSTVSVLARANTTLFGQLVSSNTTTTLTAFSLLANPAGLAFDANGDLYASDLGGVAFITAPATLVQGSPTVATIANNQGYAGALSVSNAVGPVTYVESASTYSSAIVVNSAGTITYPASTLTAGTYTVSGTDSDTNAPSGLGTWSFTLTVASPIAPPTGSPAPPPTSPTIPASTFGTPITVTDSNTLPLTIMSPTGGASESITVPVNALPSGTNVSIYPVTSNAPLVLLVPKGSTYVLSFGVSWETPAGSTPPTIVPIDATITDPTIVPGDTIYEVAPTGLVALGTASSAGTLSFTFSNDPTFLITHATVVPQGSPHATRVLGSAHVGKTVTLAIAGNHFYGQPSVTSDEAGTKAVVTHDTGTLLTLRVTVRRSSRVGEHTFTIRLANGASFKVRYSVK